MKTGKDGEVILTRNDRRVGNFVWSDYADCVAFSDINGTIRTRVSKRTLVGRMVSDAIRRGADNFLHNYAATVYYLNGVVPDAEFVRDAFRAADDCVRRRPELYGRGEVSDDADAVIIREERERREFEDSAAGLAGEG